MIYLYAVGDRVKWSAGALARLTSEDVRADAMAVTAMKTKGTDPNFYSYKLAYDDGYSCQALGFELRPFSPNDGRLVGPSAWALVSSDEWHAKWGPWVRRRTAAVLSADGR